MIAVFRRGPVLMMSGLVLSAVYTAGLYVAIRYAVDATIQDHIELAAPPEGLADDMAMMRRAVRRLAIPVGAVTVCLGLVALLLRRSRGWTRRVMLVLSAVLWVVYPYAVLSTLGVWGTFMIGDGGATGAPQRFAGWLGLGAFILFVAANLQAGGLMMLAHRDATAARPTESR
ncbi:vacuolar-type H+-ATPase subunit I/STV1 [Nonomuraea roseoviolacea subsp. carminata]|uniref:Vacuolar-type H+-ATPase subunit I/STV1 n=2 Tax=Nonomuraea TaxID=83681 RepID=A0ABT1JZG9_9ACTN|nr:vacuolar-type H+-ATPase subunit I/STV1 [Nonomuraea roseoviolacea subsp. carminata]